MGKLYLVGMGPGDPSHLTPAAEEALERSDVLCGYSVYLELLGNRFPEKPRFTTPMTKELERCRWAVAQAGTGKTVAMLCSGDAGVYGMAGPVLELAGDLEVEVVPGITAALSGAAVLGAPLTHDFCVISLSDLLTPWAVIENRLRAAALGDFVTVLYNPRSRKRPEHLRRACGILLETKAPETVCGWVRNIGREGQTWAVTTLGALKDLEADMFYTLFIGSSATRRIGERMVTPRGYAL